MPHEGVIKFQLDHEAEPLETRRYGELACKLIAWREIMALTGLVGRDPARYGGAGYGNVSTRFGPPNAPLGQRSFLITGTQTAGKRMLALEDFSFVEQYDYGQNRVRSRGRVHPSSESMTHGAVYDLAPHIRCVLHAHSPVLWRQAGRLRLPTTDTRVAYGTTEMALEVRRLYRDTVLPERRILSMGGHQDGIVVFGRTIEEAGSVLLSWLARAYESVCATGESGVCEP
jgi:ribulose-5-phosphate 4-epimerase/fuculose-1-phosphate aldolase